MKDIKLSALNLVPIREGQNDEDAINDMVKLAQDLDDLGYERYWIAEHHNAPNLVSSATALLIKHTLEHTRRIKVGSGGIMLPNHAPLVVAEQFGTMETLFPKRVDLGLGRAPGTDMMTASALRRDQHNGVYQFPEEVEQLQRYFGPDHQQAYVRAYPAVDKKVPLYILGSSTDSAHLAARKGLPYVFAGHFAPQQMKEALQIYIKLFEPSEVLNEPYVIVCLNTIVAKTDKQAEFLASTMAQIIVSITRGRMQPMKPPTDDLQGLLTPREYALTNQLYKDSLIGSEETVRKQLEDFVNEYGEIDELMAISYIYDQDQQLESYRRLQHALKE
ncbi:LLM class flavin-dependent oxidoreductase [Staphylococcus saccharolyticus]|mgnify:CR=1 FL=1|uniref:LLM class flavin-dependent oxidoreductase n=1 Tax=Staphylococcus saccharolyticus TaxID=33028 RepID=UPI00102D9144|nr:LLM class flavin-dependent oxidoreductase [Staphylococcus saccharolyticus]MBL7573355.1 LLM class flavin-dependent oxidoreductase [Staphylococcus saccharolyticus]MBL7583710.1 LLM class flavin-dependent oxidoreductase [Staphylococcus saccharolyticus]MBL7638973.1 LLM class flavin-dependent oxidoreductase [Staphylococcus saccharolyticus]QRJ69174.1 LLM class flavin-dependent oxidoreductase [Staphylococcus saccharolyticus]TAA93882.1 LLM class flavin-dependent oxidoreductase [Staphylococcus saccha